MDDFSSFKNVLQISIKKCTHQQYDTFFCFLKGYNVWQFFSLSSIPFLFAQQIICNILEWQKNLN
jgi:hypothetical protein